MRRPTIRKLIRFLIHCWNFARSNNVSGSRDELGSLFLIHCWNFARSNDVAALRADSVGAVSNPLLEFRAFEPELRADRVGGVVQVSNPLLEFRAFEPPTSAKSM